MLWSEQILADGMPGWLFPLIIVVIWALSALSGLNKANKGKAGTRPPPPSSTQTPQRLPPQQIPPRVPPHSQQRGRPQQMPQQVRTPQERLNKHVAQQKKQMPKKQLPSRKPPVKPPPPPIPVYQQSEVPAEPVVTTRIATESPFDQNRRSIQQSAQANALTLNRWLKPATLRQQWIITEVLGKPVSMRSADERAGG